MLETCVGEGQFGDSDKMRDNSVRYGCSLDCVDTIVVDLETTEEIDDSGARGRRAMVSIMCRKFASPPRSENLTAVASHEQCARSISGSTTALEDLHS